MSLKSRGVLWTLAAYATALVVAGAVAVGTHDSGSLPSAHADLWTALAADLAATLTVFVFSVGTKNHSMYDPYWSVAPPVLFGAWLWSSGRLGFGTWLWLAVVTLWSIRLTFNFYRGWAGIHRQDWRYDQLARQTGRGFLLVSAFGIHLLPTLLVFLGCLPLYAIATGGAQQLGVLEAMAAVATCGFVAVELVADEQLHRFIKARRAQGALMQTGLWRYSRHPNYFGEMGLWWGLAIGAWASGAAAWWTWLGAPAITVLFVAGSIPLLDRRSLERRPGYAVHMRRVSSVIPWFSRD